MILDPNLVHSLVAVADAGTVTDAASSLGYTPSAVSQQISRLESVLGVELLTPVGRRVELTPQALALVERAPRIFDALEEAVAAVESTSDAVGGTVRIGTFQSAAVQIVPEAVIAVRDAHPSVDIEVIVQPTAKSIRELESGALDIVLDQEFQQELNHGKLHRTELVEDRIVVVMPPDHRTPRTIADLSDDTWISPKLSNSCAAFLFASCQNAGFQPKVGYWVEDYLLLLKLVESGVGVGIASAAMAEHIGAHVDTFDLGHEAVRTIVARTRPSAMRPATKAVLQALAGTPFPD